MQKLLKTNKNSQSPNNSIGSMGFSGSMALWGMTVLLEESKLSWTVSFCTMKENKNLKYSSENLVNKKKDLCHVQSVLLLTADHL